VQLARHPLTLVDCFAKRSFDIVFAAAVLLAAGPLLLAIAALIKLDTRGPVLFRQQRHGFNNNPFRIYKFRTMTTLDDGPVVRQAQRNDARITRVGAMLRRTNLDELPQILNVLRGEMSLVGPRPHALAHNHEYEKLIALYARRHNVKPGITGWAQVQGFRGETDTIDKMEKRVECDLFYIDNWSLMLDLKILFLTVFSSKAFRNAY
jgi:exopolysaccharide biosynthesis polyprenyl glycosylphosphotransferase